MFNLFTVLNSPYDPQARQVRFTATASNSCSLTVLTTTIQKLSKLRQLKRVSTSPGTFQSKWIQMKDDSPKNNWVWWQETLSTIKVDGVNPTLWFWPIPLPTSLVRWPGQLKPGSGRSGRTMTILAWRISSNYQPVCWTLRRKTSWLQQFRWKLHLQTWHVSRGNSR